MDSIKPDWQYVRFECPSCGHVWTSSEAIERTDAAWLRFCGSPQVICPQCHGHSDPGDCFCGVYSGGEPGAIFDIKGEPFDPFPGMKSEFTWEKLSDGPEWIDPSVTPHPSVCGEATADGWQSGKWVGGPDDPHGRDPEEGTSRPYPWEGTASIPSSQYVLGPMTGGDGGPELFIPSTFQVVVEGLIPLSPIGVPPAPDCGIIDDLEENE